MSDIEKKQSLMEISQAIGIEYIQSELTDSEPDYTTIKELLRKRGDKIDGYAFYDKTCSSQIDLCNDQIKVLKAHIKKLEKRQESLRFCARAVLEETGEECLEGLMGAKIYLRETEVVEIQDLSKLPAQYCHPIEIEMRPDKNMIKDALKNGENLPGCVLITKKNVIIK